MIVVLLLVSFVCMLPPPQPETRPEIDQPEAKVHIITPNGWKHDPEISWYGPNLYGNGMACGGKLTKQTLGVAHRTLPCGTLIEFKYRGHTLTVPVVDRGPYVEGRIFDLTRGACKLLAHCFTGPIEYRRVDG